MVLVDTSVWIRFLSGRAPYAAGLDRLLDEGEVAGHDLIYGELLMGDSGGRRALLDAYRAMPCLATVPHAEVADFVRQRRLPGRGIGWADAHLLASALVAGVPLWTADEKLMRIALDLRIAHRPRA